MGLAQYLKSEFAARRARNSRYSLRAYARDLEVDHATLSQVLRGKRTLSSELTSQLCGRLGLDAAGQRLANEYDPLDAKVLTTLETMERPTSPSLAKMLRVSVDRLNVSIARLARLGVLTLEGDKWTSARHLR